MKKIRIAQIGTGHDHAGVTFAALSRMTDIFEVVGYAQVPEDNGVFHAEHYKGAKRFTAEEILAMDDLDAVAIETFDLALVPYAQKAADRGLHIQMDKAPGESAEEFEHLLSTVKQKGLAFGIGYMYRFNPAIRDAFERVKKGELGTVYAVDTDMSCYHVPQKRQWLGHFKGGMMQYLGCHLIDLVVRMQGVPNAIHSFNYSTGLLGVDAKDVAFAVLEYEKGISTVKSSCIDAGGYVRRQMVVHGEKGTIEIRPMERFSFAPSGITTLSTDYPCENWDDLGKTTQSEPFDRYEAMLGAFAAMVRGERGPEVDFETEARVHRCLLAACGIDCDYKGKIEI